MATAVITRFGDGIARGSHGNFNGDAADTRVNLGFRPKDIRVINMTDVVVYEKTDGMAAAACLKTVAAGTLTVDTTGVIVIDDRGFTILAAAFPAAKVGVWYAD